MAKTSSKNADADVAPAKRSFTGKLFIVLLCAILVLVGVHLILQHLNLNVFYQQNGQLYELSNRFDLDDEASVPTWFSHLLLLLIGMSALCAAWLQKAGTVRQLWTLIGVAGVLAAIDEIAALHEFILQSLHVMYFQDASPTSSQNAWLMVAPLVFGVFGWLGWQMWRLLPKRTFAILVFAGLIFLFGAMGVDLLTSISERETFWHQGLYVATEESMELLGCVVALCGIVDYIEQKHRLAIGEAISRLRTDRD